ncbi:WD40-repeat-containing domain protein, partial [Dimargaris cristalligena]
DYALQYSTTHKGTCTTATFSGDGRYAASGSGDTTIKVIDVSKMGARIESIEDKPVIKTLYDHEDQINDVAFHPNGLVLASSSSDCKIKLFDLTKPNPKRSFQYYVDALPVLSLSFHPSGDFIATTARSAHSLRLHDTKTFQSYTASRIPEEQHTATIRQVRYAENGSQLVTASEDGTIKLWDTVAGNCVRTLENVHGGQGAVSAQFSRNSKYILSSGRDSTIKLWETTSGRLVHQFDGATRNKRNAPAIFNHNEAMVISVDESTNSIMCWDSRNGSFIKKWIAHNSPINWIAASPTDPGIISCSDDFKIKYW